jgi:hypothetical protein
VHKSDCVYYEIIENMEHKYFETCNKKTTCCFNCEICSDYVTLEELLAIKDSYIGDLDNNLKNLRCKNNISQQANKMQNHCCIPVPSSIVPFPFSVTGCGINYHEEYNRDCKYYAEEHDMGATIPVCTKYDKFGNFNCNECYKYKR